MSMLAPLTPADCNLQDYPRMMIDIGRLRGSSFDASPCDASWRAGLNLWFSAWHQVPAASLSDDDLELVKAAGLGRDLRTWKKIRAGALHGWVKCSDGRLYHPVAAEMALECWLTKLAQRLSSGAGNAKRWGTAFDEDLVKAEIASAAEMLRRLNPKSEALRKKHVVAPGAIPAGPARDPGGTASASRRDPKEREGKGRVRKVDPHGSNLSDGEGARAPGGRASPAWSGPAAVWEAVVSAKGLDWADGFFRHTGWRDLPTPAVVCPSRQLEQELKRSATRLLSGLGVIIVREDAA